MHKIAVDRTKSEAITNEKDNTEENEKDMSVVKLTKKEKRLKVKKSRKEAKKQAMVEEKGNVGEEKLHTEVLVYFFIITWLWIAVIFFLHSCFLGVLSHGSTLFCCFLRVLTFSFHHDGYFQAKVEEDLSAEELFRKKKIKLAEIGLQLLENPEENIKSLKELLKNCDDGDQNIVKLGLMSLLAVFKDIIPG